MFISEKLSYEQLNTKSDYFKFKLPEIKEIQTLSKGGNKLNPDDYLLIRDYELENITEKRKENFSPMNYLGAAVRLQKVNQNSGTLEIDRQSLPGQKETWEKFFKKFNLKDVVLDVFEEALVSQVCYLQIEKQKLDINIPESELNQAQKEQLLKDSEKEFFPYTFIIPIQSILAEKEINNEIKWIKYKRIISIDDPFKSTLYNIEYILVDEVFISTWTFYNIKLNHKGEVHLIWDQKLNFGKGSYRKIDPKKDFATVETVEHNRGKCPVIKYKITDSLYMSNQVKDAQRLIYGLMMNCVHTVRNAGFVQKWGQPFQGGISANRDSGGVSFMPLPKQALDEMVKQTADMLGDESFLYLQHLAFEEIEGTSIDVVLRIIDFFRDYIFTSILFNSSQFENRGEKIDSQSGRSKEIDFHIQNLALKKHGATLINFSVLLLEHISLAFGYELNTEINVSGMNKFDILPLEVALELVERLFKLPKEGLPDELLSEALIQLSRLMVQNDSEEYKGLLDSAIIKKVKDYTNFNKNMLGQASKQT